MKMRFSVGNHQPVALQATTGGTRRGQAIKKLKLVHEEILPRSPDSLSCARRGRAGVHEELAAVLGVELYERSDARRESATA